MGEVERKVGKIPRALGQKAVSGETLASFIFMALKLTTWLYFGKDDRTINQKEKIRFLGLQHGEICCLKKGRSRECVGQKTTQKTSPSPGSATSQKWQ